MLKGVIIIVIKIENLIKIYKLMIRGVILIEISFDLNLIRVNSVVIMIFKVRVYVNQL